MQQHLVKNGDGVTCPIAVMVRDGKILVGHRHYTKAQWKDISVWTLPGGRSERGETIEQSLRREVVEEVGITDFKIVDFIGEVAGVIASDVVPIFYCETAQEAKLMEPEKFSEWKWVDVQDYIAGETYSGFNPPAQKMITDYLQKKLQ